MVMDARSGEVLHARNADTRLHPASLTKMMTLYLVFQAVENGEIGLDTSVKISKKAAAEPPSKLGLRPGQKIKLRYLIRAAAVKSANDAATALAEAVSGSEAAFARRMNRTAKALGMTRSTFKNAHGLTEAGHLSTARDMTLLGRQLFYDFPEYYNLFSRRSTHAGLRDVANTNRKFLAAYKGADGIKTGYTRAAGFNLVASAERGQERIIATMFGGRSTAQRNARVAELLDMGFRRAPTRVAVRKPAKPGVVPAAAPDATKPLAGKTIRVARAVETSPFPVMRPGTATPAPAEEMLVAMQETIEQTITAVTVQPASNAATSPAALPVLRPPAVAAEAQPPATRPAPASPTPAPRPEVLVTAAERDAEPDREVVTRLSTSGGRHWGINIGRFRSRNEAERMLLKTALSELGTLDEALRKVASTKRGHEANFVGMTQEAANRACRRLTARNIPCSTLGPT
ncbi:MAG: D-alanyl-D-alanine carboxypeptidase family protein [Rhodobacter sp.]|nr:D-alanyl-D-alanine carboxypeptidase family protein [Rhodobacter sp.]